MRQRQVGRAWKRVIGPEALLLFRDEHLEGAASFPELRGLGTSEYGDPLVRLAPGSALHSGLDPDAMMLVEFASG